jgi:hypothetical protein
MWISRYLLYRVAEMFNVEVTFDPKPIPGELVRQLAGCCAGWGLQAGTVDCGCIARLAVLQPPCGSGLSGAMHCVWSVFIS